MSPLQAVQAAAQSGEYQVRLVGRRAFAERVLPAPQPVARPLNVAASTAIVSGGTKNLGLVFAGDLLRRGPTKAMVLLSRDAALSKAKLAELAGSGAAVFTVTCDAGDADAMRDVLAWAREWLPPVQVVSFHHRRT